ncbi:MAG TPA: transcriptional regulator [Planctomycetaceae bacterium]|jgi:Rrf2 family protein|nr:transcriptional regulator [Planctomycetaceae bacterium]HCP11157.1 transcriptional regulator [Planctomycetaceae bacterium]
MISQTVEYSLRAIVVLAQKAGKACTAKELAAITRVPGPYLSKLMQSLVRGGLVSAQRGPNGGFQLRRDPTELTVWEIVDVLEPLPRITACPLGLKSHSGQLCPLHRSLDHTYAMVEAQFRAMTVAQLLAQPGEVSPLCEETPIVQLSGLLQSAVSAVPVCGEGSC